MVLMKRTPFSSSHSALKPAGHSCSAVQKSAGGQGVGVGGGNMAAGGVTSKRWPLADPGQASQEQDRPLAACRLRASAPQALLACWPCHSTSTGEPQQPSRTGIQPTRPLTVVRRVQRAQVGHRHAAAQLVRQREGLAALAGHSYRSFAGERLRQRAAGGLAFLAAPLAAAGAGGAAALARQPKVTGNLQTITSGEEGGRLKRECSQSYCMLRSRHCRALARQPPLPAGTAPHLLFRAVPLASRREVVLQVWARELPSTRSAAATS